MTRRSFGGIDIRGRGYVRVYICLLSFCYLYYIFPSLFSFFFQANLIGQVKCRTDGYDRKSSLLFLVTIGNDSGVTHGSRTAEDCPGPLPTHLRGWCCLPRLKFRRNRGHGGPGESNFGGIHYYCRWRRDLSSIRRLVSQILWETPSLLVWHFLGPSMTTFQILLV